MPTQYSVGLRAGFSIPYSGVLKPFQCTEVMGTSVGQSTRIPESRAFLNIGGLLYHPDEEYRVLDYLEKHLKADIYCPLPEEEVKGRTVYFSSPIKHHSYEIYGRMMVHCDSIKLSELLNMEKALTKLKDQLAVLRMPVGEPEIFLYHLMS